MRAWGRDAASDARACIRRACLASLRAADAGVLGVQSVDMDGSNYSANSSTTEKATYKAMETLPAEVFAAVIRAATHALAGHFARAELVRSAAQYALGTVAKDGGENTSRGIVADDGPDLALLSKSLEKEFNLTAWSNHEGLREG